MRPDSAVRFSVLGQLKVEVGGRPVPLGAVKQQLVLAVLLSRANAITPVDVLIDTLWADAAPRTARKNVQVYIAGIRKLLGSAGENRIGFGIGGYRLLVEPSELDSLEFTGLVTAGRGALAADGPLPAARLFREALDLWRGSPMEGLTDVPVLAEYAERIGRSYPAAFEDWAEAELGCGRAAAAVDQICELAVQNPFRERLRGLQMTALWQSGRQSEALAVFDELRQALARELGLPPGAALQQLYRRVLAGSPEARPAAVTGPVLLPPDPPHFVGRAAEIAELTSFLSRRHGGCVVVGGPTGVGRTTLAVRVARRLGHRYPDGCALVRLRSPDGAPRPASAVVADAVRSVGVDSADGLFRRRILLVLDGASSLMPVPAELIPVGGLSSVVITGRPPGGGAPADCRIELTGLTVAEALDLFGAVAGPGRVPDVRVAEAIVEAVGLLPAAVRAAGLKLRRLRHLPAAEFADRLAHPGELLDHLSGEAGLTGRVAAELAGVTVADSAAVHRLATLAAPRFTLGEAADCLGADSRTTMRMLEALIEQDLVTAPVAEVSAHAAEYELPVLIYSFARSAPGSTPLGSRSVGGEQ